MGTPPSQLLPGGLRYHAPSPGLAEAASKQEKGEAWGLPRAGKLTLKGLLSLEVPPEDSGTSLPSQCPGHQSKRES